jgi:hypothetical protein
MPPLCIHHERLKFSIREAFNPKLVEFLKNLLVASVAPGCKTKRASQPFQRDVCSWSGENPVKPRFGRHEDNAIRYFDSVEKKFVHKRGLDRCAILAV